MGVARKEVTRESHAFSHKKTRPSYCRSRISKGDHSSSYLRHYAQTIFEYHQKQNRAWLHNQVDMPGHNGIGPYQHFELMRYFQIRDSGKLTRPPLAKDGVILSQVGQEHLARFEEERNGVREKQGVPGKWSRVDNWWSRTAGEEADGVKESSKKKRGKQRPSKTNRKGKRIQAFLKKKNREHEEKEAAAKAVLMRKGMGKMQIAEEGGERVTIDDGQEESDNCEVEMRRMNENQRQKAAPRCWVQELPIRGA